MKMSLDEFTDLVHKKIRKPAIREDLKKFLADYWRISSKITKNDIKECADAWDDKENENG